MEKKRFILIIAVMISAIGLTSLFILIAQNSASTFTVVVVSAAPASEHKWHQANTNGFGNSSNCCVLSLELFDGQIYAGVGNWAEGNQIFRSSDGKSWTAVNEVGFGPAYTNTLPAVIDMVEFNNQLYASTGWGSAPGQIWRSPDGTAWSQVVDGGFSNSNNSAIVRFIVFNNYLYASTVNNTDGAEIWRSATGNIAAWENVVLGGDGKANNESVNSFTIFNGELYAAGRNATDGAEIWRTIDGTTWTQVNLNGFGNADNVQIGSIVVYENMLYASTSNNVAGGEIWRSSNGTTWTQFAAGGLGDTNNANIGRLCVFDGKLYVSADNFVVGMKVWVLAEGDTFEQINLDGFGDSNNQSGLWDGVMVTEDGFYIGTSNGTNGGELWRYGLYPIPTSVYPNVAPNDIDTTIIITGTGFVAASPGTETVIPPTVQLNGYTLPKVGWISSTQLTATVPWGLVPDIYSLTVTNPDEQSGTLPDAFSVTQSIGVWTTGGPYGGEMVEIIVHPTIPTKVFALAGGTGLFVSEDAGEHWEFMLSDGGLTHMAFTPSDPDVMYLTSQNTLYVSRDSGSTWETNPHPTTFPAVHPNQPGVIYVAFGPDRPGEGDPNAPYGIYRSADYGHTWLTMTNGLTDTYVTALAFFTDDPSGMHMVAGTANGNIFTSANGGESWQWAAKPCATYIDELKINPWQPQQVWTVYDWRVVSGPSVFKSLDESLTQWMLVDITQNVNSTPRTITFEPDQGSSTVTGTIWAGITNSDVGMGVYSSTDGGLTWDFLPNSPVELESIALDSINPQNIYAGTRCGHFGDSTPCGVYKSEDRGASWSQINEGLSGISPGSLAVSATDPDRVYAYSILLGLLGSNNGGRSWQDLGVFGFGSWRADERLATDPFIPLRLYLGGSSGPLAGQPTIQMGNDNGQGWQTYTFTVPAQDYGGEVFAVAPHPLIPGSILAGVFYESLNENDGSSFGSIFLSTDYGETWNAMTITQPISGVTGFAYDALDPNLVYAVTFGEGYLKSEDGGRHWQPITSIDCSGGVWAHIVTHPYNSGHVIACWQRSLDAGENWTPIQYVSGAGDTWHFAPTWPPALYVGDGSFNGGLWRSFNNGDTWEHVNGMTDTNIFAIASGIDQQRSVMYVSVSGGFVAPAALNQQSNFAPSQISGSRQVMGGGVYRLTTVMLSERLFLPLVVQGYAP